MEIVILITVLLIGLYKIQIWMSCLSVTFKNAWGCVVIKVVTWLEALLNRAISKCQWACEYLHTYRLKVEQHEEDVVVPLLFKWMCDEREGFTAKEKYTAEAVDLCAAEIGQRVRCPTSEEAVGRSIRRTLTALKVGNIMERALTDAEVVYWGEIGTQMYFNPPYTVKAATGKLLCFQ
uniref:Uncharacterized protein n=1 Tax=Riboviria sp. TaxID=2585031 RepID=A0A514D483_9VIRU|nr:MAG: hypothetical protein H4BulkLitter234368_000001 [Riboviria sp.]